MTGSETNPDEPEPRRDEPRFRISGDALEALKVLLAQLPDEDQSHAPGISRG